MKPKTKADETLDKFLRAFETADKPFVHSITFRGSAITANYLPSAYQPDSDAGEWVYFLRAGDFVKIGYTTDLASRLKRLQTGSPHELRLLVLLPGTKYDEATFHRRFGSLRAHGEWFKLDGALLDFLSEQYQHQKAAV